MRKQLLLLGLAGLLGVMGGCASTNRNQKSNKGFSNFQVAQERKATMECDNVSQELSALREKLQTRYSEYNVDSSVWENYFKEYCAFCNSEEQDVWEVNFKGTRQDLIKTVDSEYKKRYGENYEKFGLALMSSFASELIEDAFKINSDSKIYERKINIPNHAFLRGAVPMQSAPTIIIEDKTVKAITSDELKKYMKVIDQKVY